MINKDRLINTFVEMVEIPSLSLKEKEFAKYLEKKLRELNFEVKVDNSHFEFNGETGNIIAYKKGKQADKTYGFVAHMDTVVPGENINPIIENGIIKSDGTTILGADDKAGISALIEVANVLSENNIEHASFYYIFTFGEEKGLYGAKGLDLERLNLDGLFVLDSEGDIGRVVISGPSQNTITATFMGKPAHAGSNPEDGISSIVAASKAISNMPLGRIDEETTANIGIIKGGMATNIVPEKTVVYGEARSRSEEKLEKQTNEMKKAFENAADETGARVEVEIHKEYGAFNISENHELVNIVKSALDKMGLPLITEATGGGSDTNIFNAKGVPAINLSVGMEEVHTKKEFIQIDNLYNITKLILKIITEEI